MRGKLQNGGRQTPPLHKGLSLWCLCNEASGADLLNIPTQIDVDVNTSYAATSPLPKLGAPHS